MSFHEVRFPARLSIGSTGGPERRTDVVTLVNGFEERNSPWSQSRRRYDAGLGVQSHDDLHDILEFFEARCGRLYGFRWKDPIDCKSGAPSAAVTALDQPIGTGDAATRVFQLTKTYASGEQSHVRDIAKPVAGSVLVAVDGVVLVEGVEFTVDLATGGVTLTDVPNLDAAITAGFEFDVPARFDTDRIDISLAALEAGEIPSIPVVEIRV